MNSILSLMCQGLGGRSDSQAHRLGGKEGPLHTGSAQKAPDTALVMSG